MGTRSNIIIKRPGLEEYAGIYCHWDGYPSHSGRILLLRYPTHDEVVELINLGNLSSLGESAEECVSYHRWRGEDKNIRVSNNANDLFDQEYGYLFKDERWYLTSDGNSWKLLTMEMCK